MTPEQLVLHGRSSELPFKNSGHKRNLLYTKLRAARERADTDTIMNKMLMESSTLEDILEENVLILKFQSKINNEK